MTNKITTQILTYLGVLPFVFFTILNVLAVEYFFNIKVNFLLIGYAVVILSFVSGLNFSYGLKQNNYAIYYLIISNIIALIAYYHLLSTHYVFSYATILVAFLFCLVLDFYAYKAKIIAGWFFKLRLNITALVSLCLGANIIFS